MSRPFNVDLPGLLRVFGGHLYSNAGVFVRELVQNGVDAIVEQRRTDPAFVGRVTITSDEDAGVVTMDDDGVGLDHDRIESCLARIAYSSKTDDDDLLGRFGIGLLSAFLVAKEIVVDTKRDGGEPFRWRASPDGTYVIERGDRQTRGTTVRLTIADGQERYARASVIRELLETYVRFLPFDVVHEGTRVTVGAPWEATDPFEAVRAFAGELPLAVFRMDRGLLWLRATRGGDGGRMDVFLRGMLLERGTKKLLPKWASFVGGVVDAPSLSPTASRETFVDDEASHVLAASIRTALLEGLARIATEDPASFERVLSVHSLSLRGACIDHPELLDAIGDRIPFETNVGSMTLGALLGRENEKVLRYVATPQDFAHTSPLANAQGIPLVDASYTYDVPFLEAFGRARAVSLVRLSIDELEVLIRPAPELVSRFAKVLAAAREALEPFGVSPELGRFEPSAMPAFLVSDALATHERAHTLAAKTSSALVKGLLAARPKSDLVRFVLNVENKLVAALPDVEDEERVRRVVRLLHAQSSMTLRRSLSIVQSRAFSEDLLALIASQVAPHLRGDWN